MYQRKTLIERWAAGRSMPVTPGATRLTLSIDGKYRVHLSEAPNRKVSIESRVSDMPSDHTERERLIEKALQISAGRMRKDPCILAVDSLEAELLLQAEASADADERELSETIGRFVNSLAFWRRVV